MGPSTEAGRGWSWQFDPRGDEGPHGGFDGLEAAKARLTRRSVERTDHHNFSTNRVNDFGAPPPRGIKHSSCPTVPSPPESPSISTLGYWLTSLYSPGSSPDAPLASTKEKSSHTGSLALKALVHFFPSGNRTITKVTPASPAAGAAISPSRVDASRIASTRATVSASCTIAASCAARARSSLSCLARSSSWNIRSSVSMEGWTSASKSVSMMLHASTDSPSTSNSLTRRSNSRGPSWWGRITGTQSPTARQLYADRQLSRHTLISMLGLAFSVI
mmetsp:Transcript_8528/g.23047  ORF Transcript_8528/g.23047 Transcript_8528/m.23047 type:complete len:275 (-) Transcript_8528:719-1543(-)